MSKTDLSYSGVEYGYERSGCICNDWPCRCTTIRNTWIENIDINKVMTELLHNNFIKTNKLTEIDLYCFDRICRVNDIWDKYLYDIEVCPGYYGEEIHGVFFGNEDRNWVLTWPDGTTTSKRCTCSQPDYWYEPEETWIDTLKYKIKNSNYQFERYYRLDKSYQYTGDSRWNDYSYEDFGIQFVYDKFCEDVIEKTEQLGYMKKIGFKSKEECQKYCDWLNERKGAK